MHTTCTHSARRFLQLALSLGVALACALGVASRAPAAAAATGLVAAYSFDEGSGSVLRDDSGNGADGVISGATWSGGGKHGGALSFDGGGDLVTVPDNPSLHLRTALTIEAWVDPSELVGSWRTVVVKEQPGQLAYALYAYDGVSGPTGNVYVGGDRSTAAAGALAEGAWAHLATTYDGSTLRLYVNGQLASSLPVSGTIVDSDSPLRIGGNTVWDEWFAGLIDDVRVYDRALSATEISADMERPVGASELQAPGAPAADDTQPPSVPQGQEVTPASGSSLVMSWQPSSDDVGVAGYRVYLNDLAVGETTGLRYLYTGLSCGTSYLVGLEAYDAAGNASNRRYAQGSVVTDACVDGPDPAPGPAPAPAPEPEPAPAPAPEPPPAPAPAPPPAPEPPPVPAGGANLWVDVNGGSCVRSASLAGYVDGAACSWDGAYRAALSGDLILVKGGSYGDVQVGPGRAGVVGVRFAAAAGESVSVRDFENGSVSGSAGASDVSFLGPVSARTFRSDGTSNVTVDGWRVDCGGCENVQVFHLEGDRNVVVRNSEISDNNDNSLIWINGSELTFEHDQIHDAGLPAGSGAHTECLYAWDVTNLVLRGNHFYHCSVMDVFVTGGAVAHGGFVENNVFEKPWENTGVVSNSALAFHFRNGGDPSPDPDDWDFRYNTFVGPLSVSDENPVGSGGMRVVGNVFLADAPCGLANTTYAYNAFVSGACGSNSLTASLASVQAGFMAPSSGGPGDYRLRSDSVLRDRGNPADYPVEDAAGTARYSGGAPDLGAYEGQ